MKKYKFTSLAIFIIFFGTALFNAFQKQNWIEAALFLAWRKGLDRRDIKIALSIFLGQLVLNTLWSIIFFGLHSPGGALIEIVFLWLVILATIVAFYKISPPSSSIWTTAGHRKHAAWPLVPYILWVSFAAYLNYAIWMLN